MGGKAFEGVTRRIMAAEVECTLRWLEDQWPDFAKNGGNLGEHLLGSGGRIQMGQSAGDLDLNLHIDRYDQATVAEQLTQILGPARVKARPGNNQIFTAIPIAGSNLDFVQVDFMFGDHRWQKFSYWSSPFNQEVRWASRHTTAFKGLYRTELIKALVAFNSDWVLEEDGQVVARVGPTFFHDRGLVWRYRHRPLRKDGSARVKALEELSRDDFLEIYPSAITAKMDSMTDPEEVAKMLFDKSTTSKDLDTIEYMAQLLRLQYDDHQRRKIVEIFLERLSNLKVEVPTDKFRQIWLR